MKYVFPLFLVMMTPIAQALPPGFLENVQGSQLPAPASSSGSIVPGSSLVITSSNNAIGAVGAESEAQKICTSQDQKTLPLSHVELLSKGQAGLELKQDPVAGQVHVKGNPTISNCDSMLTWKVRLPTENAKYYILERAINTKSCVEGDATCSFSYATVNSGSHSEVAGEKFSPTVDGYYECLVKSGAMTKEGKIDSSKAIYKDVNFKLSNFTQSAPVYFGSRLPLASARYEMKDKAEDGCYLIEDVVKDGFSFLSKEDLKKKEVELKAMQVCQSGNHQEMTNFIMQYEDYVGDLNIVQIREKTLVDEYKKLSEALRSPDKELSLDLSVIKSFQDHVIEPLKNKIDLAYEDLQGLQEGSEAYKTKLAELNQLKKDFLAYKASPYMSKKELDELVKKGNFDEAEIVNRIHLSAEAFAKVDEKHNGVFITPTIARRGVEDQMKSYRRNLAKLEKEYDLRTGRSSGTAQAWIDKADYHLESIAIAKEDYAACHESLTREMQRCMRINSQPCFARAQKALAEAKLELAQILREETEIVKDLEAKAEYYGKLEDEGREYVRARQIGSDDEDEDDEDEEDKPSRTRERGSRFSRYVPEAPEEGYTFPTQSQFPTQAVGMPGVRNYNEYMPNQQFVNNSMGQNAWHQYAAQGMPQVGYGNNPNYGGGSPTNYVGQGGVPFPYSQFSASFGTQPGYQGYGNPTYQGQQNIWGTNPPQGANNPFNLGNAPMGQAGYNFAINM